MARGMDFRKPVLREYTAPSNLCLCQYRPKVSHYFSHSSGKSLAAFLLHENFLLKASHCIRYVQRTLNNLNWVQINIQVNEDFRYMYGYGPKFFQVLFTTTRVSSVLSCEDLLISSLHGSANIWVFIYLKSSLITSFIIGKMAPKI